MKTIIFLIKRFISNMITEFLYIYIYNLHNGECASVFNALLKTRRVSAFAFLRGLNMQLLQSRNWLIYIYIYLYISCSELEHDIYIFIYIVFRAWTRSQELYFSFSTHKLLLLQVSVDWNSDISNVMCPLEENLLRFTVM